MDLARLFSSSRVESENGFQEIMGGNYHITDANGRRKPTSRAVRVAHRSSEARAVPFTCAGVAVRGCYHDRTFVFFCVSAGRGRQSSKTVNAGVSVRKRKIQHGSEHKGGDP